MTRQPAVKVGLLFSMAINAKSHLKAVFFEPVHGLHRTVAFLTGDLLLYVPLMVEQYVLRDVEHFLPWSRRFVVEVPVLLLDPRMLGDYVLVTMQTLFHRRDPGKIGIGRIGMTVEALDLLYPCMNLVAERNRLFRAYVGGVIIEEIKEQDDGKRAEEGEEQGPPVPF
jgi:hypothetical protein